MCQQAYHMNGEAGSIQELGELIGKENIVWLDGYESWASSPHFDPTACLCGVDIEASAKKAGWLSEWDPFGFRLRKEA